MDRKRAAERRARESESQREQRLALGRQRAAERRAMESEQVRECRLAQNRKRIALKRASKGDRLSLAKETEIEDMAKLEVGLDSEQVDRELVVDVQRFQSSSSDSEGGQEAEQTFKEVERTPVALPVVDWELEVEMAGVQQQGVVEQTAPGGGKGEEKSGELKQEVVEIKEFRAGTKTSVCQRVIKI